MKKTSFALILLILLGHLFAYENSMLNMYSPTSLDNHQGQFAITHRFFGDIEEKPFDNLFGMTNGVNIGFGLRYQFLPKIEATFNYTKLKKETQFGLSYKFVKEDFPIFSQLNFEYYTFKEPLLNEDRRSNFKSVVSLQNEELFDRLIGTLNAGYDFYYERPIVSIGANIKIFDKVSLIGEYYPVLDRSTSIKQLKRYLKDADVFAIGIKLDTYGHHFKFQISNSEQNSLHRLTMGADNEAPLMFGFNLERRLGI